VGVEYGMWGKRWHVVLREKVVCSGWVNMMADWRELPRSYMLRLVM